MDLDGTNISESEGTANVKTGQKARSTSKCCSLPERHHGGRAPSSSSSPSVCSPHQLLSTFLSPTLIYFNLSCFTFPLREHACGPHIGRENCACAVMKHSWGRVMVAHECKPACCHSETRAEPGWAGPVSSLETAWWR